MKRIIPALFALLAFGAAFMAFNSQKQANGVEFPQREPFTLEDALAGRSATDDYPNYAQARFLAEVEQDEFERERDIYGTLAVLAFAAMLISMVPWGDMAAATGAKVSKTFDTASDIYEKRKQRRGPKISHSKGVNQFLVADELAKWRRLLVDGTVTQEEYDAIKAKLLGQPASRES